MNIKINGFTVTDALWFAGEIGIVFGITHDKYTRIYIGNGIGISEKGDIENIVKNGRSVNELVGKKIIEHLKHVKKT